MSTPTNNPVEAEALGLGTVTAAFMGREWRIPADVDTWPLRHVKGSIYLSPTRVPTVNHIAIAQALEILLGDQWDAFLGVAVRRRHLVPATHAFAEAVGIRSSSQMGPDGKPFDRAWGSIPRLLAVLEAWPTAVESDLTRFWSADYRDRWRFDADGHRLLTLRQIHARLSHLPADSALAVEMGRRSPTELLLMDIYEPLAGRAHPARPLTPEQVAERNAEAAAKAKALAAYEARREARGDRRISTALDNARANAQRGKSGNA